MVRAPLPAWHSTPALVPEPGARLLNHWRAQACSVPCPQARVMSQTEVRAFGCSCRIGEENWHRLFQSPVHTSKGSV